MTFLEEFSKSESHLVVPYIQSVLRNLSGSHSRKIPFGCRGSSSLPNYPQVPQRVHGREELAECGLREASSRDLLHQHTDA